MTLCLTYRMYRMLMWQLLDQSTSIFCFSSHFLIFFVQKSNFFFKFKCFTLVSVYKKSQILNLKN